MFGQFAGERLTLSGGVLSNLRMTETGFRFVLDLQPGYDLGNFPVSGIDAPGRFLLDYDAGAGRFTARPSSPANPVIESITTNGPATTLQPIHVATNLANSGLDDAGTMPLIATATRPGGSPRVITQSTVGLLGQSRHIVPVSWTPPGNGDWTVAARLYTSGGADERTVSAPVARAPKPSWQSVATVGWPETWPLAYLIALLGLIALPAVGGLLLLRRPG
jgi:hypothetical protein